MDARRSPRWILNDHPEDQFLNLLRCPQNREIEIIRTIEPTQKTSEDFVTRMTSEPLDEQRRVMGERVVAV